ncbi:hypothetical protein HZC09_01770 [Candidatus Micrarchaeota archaeon]|nr:hypothetical protein [Candidatus Micrarchaeota archaeon]
MSELEKAKEDVEVVRKQVQSLVLKNKEALANMRELYATAKSEKEKRDGENAKVKELKGQKAKAEEAVAKAKEAMDKSDAALKNLQEMDNPRELKRQIEQLEWIQQTEASPKEEKELSKKINDLRKKLPAAEEKSGAFAERAKVRDELRKANAAARETREKMRETAKKSDEHHATYVKALKKASALQEKLSEAFKDLDQKRALLKTERDEFDQMRGEIRQQAKEEREKERKEQESIERRQKQKATEMGKEALEGFKKGKKLTLEDLQAIQEAGLVG